MFEYTCLCAQTLQSFRRLLQLTIQTGTTTSAELREYM